MRRFLIITIGLAMVLGYIWQTNAQLDPLGSLFETQNRSDTYTSEQIANTDATRLSRFLDNIGAMTNSHATPLSNARDAERDAYNNIQRSLLDLTVVERRFL